MALKQITSFKNFSVVDHPLLLHKLSLLRDKNSSKKKFNELVNEITIMLAYEATSDLPLTSTDIETPLEKRKAPVIDGKKPVLVPILRAGLGMVDGFLSLMPGARVGHVGLYRDEETLQPHSYYFKVPKDSSDRIIFVVDPMLATGGSACDAIAKLKEEGMSRFRFVCLVASPEGVEKLNREHPEVQIICAGLDRELSSKGYILPGLGDAGDRLFGTK